DVHLSGGTKDRPTASRSLELKSRLHFLDVSAARVERDSSGMAFKDDDGIRGSSQPKCAGDRIKWIIGLHFANMMINNDRDAVLACNLLQASYRCIIGTVGG